MDSLLPIFFFSLSIWDNDYTETPNFNEPSKDARQSQTFFFVVFFVSISFL